MYFRVSKRNLEKIEYYYTTPFNHSEYLKEESEEKVFALPTLTVLRSNTEPNEMKTKELPQ